MVRHSLGLEHIWCARRPQEEAARAGAEAEAKAAADRPQETTRRDACAASGRPRESLLQRLLKGTASGPCANKAPAPRPAAAAVAHEVITISDSDDDEPAKQPPARLDGTARHPGAAGGAETAAASPAGATRSAPASTAAASATAEQACVLSIPVAEVIEV